jgi:hypothetical protein
MEVLIALLALMLLIVPMLAGIRRLRRLPPRRGDGGETDRQLTAAKSSRSGTFRVRSGF